LKKILNYFRMLCKNPWTNADLSLVLGLSLTGVIILIALGIIGVLIWLTIQGRISAIYVLVSLSGIIVGFFTKKLKTRLSNF